VAWAEFPLVSLKRWFKEFGNIIVLMVILTEVNPGEAIRAVFVRNAYVLIPLSFIFIRWFPDIGRRYSMHSGEMEAIGVTNQKNDLGAIIFVCGLMCLWDLLERVRKNGWLGNIHSKLLIPLIALGAYLLHLCDSKTSIVCLVLSATVLALSYLPVFRARPAALGLLTVVGLASAGLADWLFGIREAAVEQLGRDMTFTGRTDVWRELLSLNTDPIIGTGFCSFWSNKSYLSQLPEWVAHSAHNGYLEIYIDVGWVGIFFLSLMLVATGFSLVRRLFTGGRYALVSLMVFLAALIDNFSESYFGRMSVVGFLFLLTAVDYTHLSGSEVAADLTNSEAPINEIPLDAPVMAFED